MCQNVSKEVLLSAFKNQAKLPSSFEDCVQRGGRKNEGLMDTGHSLGMILDRKKAILGSQQW